MNVFVLDQSPYVAAAYYANKHITKMPTEVASMLLWPFQLAGYSLPLTKDGNTRKLSHCRHPASLWIRESRANYDWALDHLWALCQRYTELYGKTHDAQRLWRFCRDAPRCLNFGKDHLTPFARCFGPFKQELEASEPNTIEAYRKFYWLDKRDFARWPALAQIPGWWPGGKDARYVDKSFSNGVYSKL